MCGAAASRTTPSGIPAKPQRNLIDKVSVDSHQLANPPNLCRMTGVSDLEKILT
jgi:hypothetical protein